MEYIPEKQKGFSLSEFMIALFLFSILSSSLAGTIIIGMRYYQKSNLGTEAQMFTRNAIEFISNEIRQAVPNPDPGLNGNTPTGYKAVSPSIDPTGVLYPNVNEISTDYVVFTIPDYDYYDPSDEDWFSQDPRNYKKVKYAVYNQNELIRETTTYNSDGSINTRTQLSILTFSEGVIELSCKYTREYGNQPVYTITVSVETAVEEQSTYKRSFSLQSSVTIPGDD